MQSRHIFQFIILLVAITSSAQDAAPGATVEKSVYSIRAGLIGAWGNAEFRLAREFALRAEIGAELGTATYDYNNDVDYLLIPVVMLEPRWYYNLDRRARKGKRTAKNSGNAFSVNLKYSPDKYLTSSNDRINIPQQLAIIPSWGIRRVYGSGLTFETGIGVGPNIALGADYADSETSDIYVDLKVRIGYTF